jgi:hypothetical protein
MQIRPADAACRHLDTNLPRRRSPIGQFGPFQGRPEFVQNHCPHRVFLRVFGQLAVSAVIGPLVSVRKTLEHAWRQIRQSLGQEVRSERRGRCAPVAISPLPRGEERNHALRECRKRCRSEHRLNRQWRVTGAFAFRMSQDVSTWRIQRIAAATFSMAYPAGDPSQPKDLLGVRASESPPTATALRVDSYE